MSKTQELPTTTQDAPHESPVLIQALHPVNLLSFGPDTPEIPLGPLNILIGPNGSGKSNFIEIIDLLRSCAGGLADTIRRGGGIREWIWKGQPEKPGRLTAKISSFEEGKALSHSFLLETHQQTFRFTEEEIRDASAGASDTLPALYSMQNELVVATSPGGFGGFGGQTGGGFGGRGFGGNREQEPSVLKRLYDPQRYPEIAFLADIYPTMRCYREWAFGRNTVFREPQRTDMRTDRLEENFSNLSMFLNRLRRDPKAKNKILHYLRDIYEGADDFDVSIEGSTVQVFFTEGEFTIPATRLSDGTLRYLCLLAILCDPKPPPLICIEEPELGLHPDILPKIADLLVEASGRTQLIVTTHSDILVDAMTERPEAVLICEKHAGQTQMTRLSREGLSVWLEKYRLGELWTSGELGGMRW